MLNPDPETIIQIRNTGSDGTILFQRWRGEKEKLKFSRKTKIFLVYMPTGLYETFMKLRIFSVPRKRRNSHEMTSSFVFREKKILTDIGNLSYQYRYDTYQTIFTLFQMQENQPVKSSLVHSHRVPARYYTYLTTGTYFLMHSTCCTHDQKAFCKDKVYW
jgi:hypothetical protein